MNKMKYYKLAIDTYELIKQYAKIGEDYSLLQRNYNEMIELYELDLYKMQWISPSNFEMYKS